MENNNKIPQMSNLLNTEKKDPPKPGDPGTPDAPSSNPPEPTGEGSVSAIKLIERFLRRKYLFRYNVVSNKVEFKATNNLNASFEDMRDRDYCSVLRELKLADISCSMSTLQQVLKSDYVSEYNPYLEYANGLEPWDGITDHIKQLAQTVSTDDAELFEFCFRKWFVAMVASWLHKKAVNHTALILSGRQGVGKTTWLTNLVPPPLRQYVYSGRVNLNDKDSQIKLSECPLIIMDELENLTAKGVEGLKELITKSNIYVRRAYGFVHESYVRRASFAGSTNSKDILHDISGNRRFLCFEVSNIDYQHSLDIGAAIAQAIDLSNNGFQYWFDPNEIQQIELHNEGFRAMCREEEQLGKYYEKCPSGDPNAEFLMTSDLLRSLSQLSGMNNLSGQKLGKILHKLQFERIKRNDRYVYVLKRKATVSDSGTPSE